MGNGYRVTPDDLDAAAGGVRDVLDRLAQLTADRAWAQEGRGTVMIAAAAGPIGHAALAGALEGFCSRWEWGVRTAVRSGRALADGLAASAGDYAVADDLDRVMADVTADPRDPARPGQRIETWRDWEHTLSSVGATWSATAREVWAGSGPGMVQRAVEGRNPIQGLLDDVAGMHGILE